MKRSKWCYWSLLTILEWFDEKGAITWGFDHKTLTRIVNGVWLCFVLEKSMDLDGVHGCADSRRWRWEGLIFF